MKLLLAPANLLPAVPLAEWGYQVVQAENGHDAWQMLQQDDAIRLAILKWEMSEMDGIEVCRRVREADRKSYTYLILHTTKNMQIGEAMESGADDYLTWSVSQYQLRARLRVARRLLELEDELTAAREALHTQATYDPLTRLWNQTAVMDLFRQDISRARREGSSVVVAMAEVDPPVDEITRQTSDAILVATAERASGVIRIYDKMARLAQNRFLFILPNCTLENGGRIMERIRSQFTSRPINTSEGAFPVTLTFGLTAWENEQSASQDALFSMTEQALECAILAGRNRVVISEQAVGG